MGMLALRWDLDELYTSTSGRSRFDLYSFSGHALTSV